MVFAGQDPVISQLYPHPKPLFTSGHSGAYPSEDNEDMNTLRPPLVDSSQVESDWPSTILHRLLDDGLVNALPPVGHFHVLNVSNVLSVLDHGVIHCGLDGAGWTVIFAQRSGGIIARSVVLRQRQRIAMANGTWMPPGRREAVVHVRAKPVIFDAHVAGRDSAGLEQRWHTMKPFAASTIPPARPRSPTSLRLVSSPAPGLRTAHGGMRNVLRLYNIFRSSSPSPLSTTELQSPPAAAPSPPLRVAVFVCMPCSIQDDELPHMEFGVLEAEVVDPRKKSSQSDGDGSAV
ncbi:hypothetical protein B0H10DRAFT_1950059 [Mycena sp. CBHHK59/15]|nr:hypothetical protein B0H10DRAFT_1950059 [Mycena sp. CBHHK59/15]